MAEPQRDAYDSNMILKLMNATAAPADPGVVWFVVAPVYAREPAFRRDFAGFRDAPANHPNLARAVELLDFWPQGALFARRLIRIVHAAYENGVAEDLGWGTLVSSSHSYEHAFGTCHLTVHSPVGVAEAIVHEAAHHKLRALGVRFESADAIVAGDGGWELYPNPLLDGRLRPLPAILHAHYVLLHLIALEAAILAQPAHEAHRLVRRLLARNTTRLARSGHILRGNLVLDEIGTVFMEAVWRWQERLLCESQVYL
jgi:HEXXH motif-containing protein